MRLPFIARAAVLTLLTVVAAASAAAQTASQVRVTSDRATIWRPGFPSVAATVSAGTVLEAVSRQGDWYEVVLPDRSGQTGMIYVGLVTLVEGSPEPPRRATSRSQPSSAGEPDAGDLPSTVSAIGVRGFGSFGYDWMSARKAFDAVLGHSGGFLFGGGGQFRWNQIVIEVSAERFRRTGHRVFVTDAGDVFKLGIPDTVTITPLTFTAEYRFTRRVAAPYVGGGVGQYGYKEESSFADPSENVDRHFTSYHVLGGYEWRNGLVATGFELQYTHVPNALGEGAAAAFNEHNLGGVQARVKILVGR